MNKTSPDLSEQELQRNAVELNSPPSAVVNISDSQPPDTGTLK